MSQLTPTVEPKKQSQVTEQTSNLESNLGVLHDVIGKLQDRLSSVLRTSVPSEKEKGKDRAELVILADTIEGFDDFVKSATSKIEDILDRLEL